MKNPEKINDIDSYLEQQTEKVRLVLEKLRKTIKSVVPEAEELISYQMPSFKYHGMLVHFAAFKDHCSLFPGGIVENFKDELKYFKTSKGTIQFTAEKPLPAALVKKIVKARVEQNLIKSKLKLKNKKMGNKITQKITPFLWFEKGAEEAANFYISIFKNSRILTSNPLVTSFEIDGIQIAIINGGPVFKLSEAFSLSISCETQEEIDYYWEKLTEGGSESQCGWLKDKYGVSWQVVPSILPELMSDPENAKKVTAAFIPMQKLDIEILKKSIE